MPPMPAKRPPAAEFEYCDLCRHHHDHGRRHRYIPKHRRNLDAALTSFRSKLSDLRRTLIHGFSSSQPPRARLWCPFCSTGLDSHSACNNAIYHLASSEHLKGVKDFLRRHGGGMDQVDSLRISEDMLAKWEKSYGSLSAGTKETEGLIGPSLKPIKAMGHITLLVQRVMELPALQVLLILLRMGLLDCPSQLGDQLKHMSSRVHCPQTGFIAVVLKQKVQQIHSGGNLSNGSKANVHTGAPPPWLKANEHDPKNLSLRSCGLPSRKGKLRKLNPKRVGAAWAERRRAEMEMEKQGEIVPETSDSSWLPNFGSVWQSGTRKESRKEFEKSHKLHDTKSNNDDLSLEIKPYISKRMRVGVDEASDKAEQLGSHLEQ